ERPEVAELVQPADVVADREDEAAVLQLVLRVAGEAYERVAARLRALHVVPLRHVPARRRLLAEHATLAARRLEPEPPPLELERTAHPDRDLHRHQRVASGHQPQPAVFRLDEDLSAAPAPTRPEDRAP